MKRAAFEIKQSATGNYYFTFKSLPEQANIISCSFPDRAELEKCLARVREAAPLRIYVAVNARTEGLRIFGFNLERMASYFLW
jgi:hypothetical protein